MEIIEPHIHMVSRTVDDYMSLALSGVRTVSEPAFWAGFDRGNSDGFRDYFEQLTVAEPARAKKFGVKHYCWICLNPKEAENISLAKEVLSIIPEFLDRPSVLGIGEIGLNKNSRNELAVLEQHLELAAIRNELVLVHTPHLEDKFKGTRLIMDAISNEPKILPHRVLIDHAEEHTIKGIKDKGFWAGLTIYPCSKCSPERAIDMVEIYGSEMIWINSAADWGISDPLAMLKAANEMALRGHGQKLIRKIFFENPAAFLGQCEKFKL